MLKKYVIFKDTLKFFTFIIAYFSLILFFSYWLIICFVILELLRKIIEKIIDENKHATLVGHLL